MANQVLLTVLLIICILKFGKGYYYHSRTTERMKSKIVYLERELIKEAIRNIQRIDFIKEIYKISPVYDIGQMLYFIRSKFARMVRVFVLAYENDAKLYSYHMHLPSMKEIHHLGLEIYHLIEMLEEYDIYPFKRDTEINVKKRRNKHKKSPLKSGVNLLRQRPTNIPSLSKKDFYARKPNERFIPLRPAGRSGIMVNRTRDIDAFFESDIE